MEGIIYANLGLTIFSYTSLRWSYDLFIAELLFLIIGRFCATLGLMGIFRIFGYKSGLSI